MKVGRVGEGEVEITLQPELFQEERRGKEKEERGNPVEEVTVKEETELDRKGRVEEAIVTLAEVSLKMKRAMASREWGIMEFLKTNLTLPGMSSSTPSLSVGGRISGMP